MSEEDKFSIETYLEIVRYRKWLLIVPVVLMILLTGIGTRFMSDIYRGQTLIRQEETLQADQAPGQVPLSGKDVVQLL